MKRFLGRLNVECYMDMIVEADDKDDAQRKLQEYADCDYISVCDLHLVDNTDIESLVEISDNDSFSYDDRISYEEFQ